MSDPCEIVEALALATSSCPATEVVVVQVASGRGTSHLVLGITQPVVINTAAAVSTVEHDAYALLVSAASAASTVTPSAIITQLQTDTVHGRSTLFVVFAENATSSAAATSSVLGMSTEHVLLSVAVANSTVTPHTVATSELYERATARSSVVVGLLESVTESAAASSTVTVLRTVLEVSYEAAQATSTVFPSNIPQAVLLVSTAQAVSTVASQLDAQALAASTAHAESGVSYKDPDRVAWLMNTETTAASWYDNFDFESIAQSPGKVLAVSADGLYELSGATDAGDTVDAMVKGGFGDFGTPQTKRVDNLYFGYNSGGRISVTLETKESGHSPTTYFLEQRVTTAPRNSRITPGKGLWGRYWRMTLRNVVGADFEIHDASADIAESPRRI